MTEAFLAPVWAAAGRGRFVVQECHRCGNRQWTPQPACRACLAEEPGWLECSGHATIYSLTVVYRSPDPSRFTVPYVLAVVELDEGPYVLTRLDADPDALPAIGSAVEVVFRPGGPGDPAPVVYEFVPSGAA